MVVLTEGGLTLISQMFSNETDEAVAKIQLGSGNTTEELTSNSALDSPITDYGCGIATATTIEYLNTAEHPQSLHLRKIFSPVGGEITIREIGVLSDGASPILVMRKVFSEFELENNGVVPAGESITIDAYLSFSYTPGSYTCQQSVNIGSVSLIITPSLITDLYSAGFSCPPGTFVCFNGRALRNAEIVSVTERRGARAWEFRCYTQDYSDISKINAVAAPVEVGLSITGRQYTSSMLKTGTLRIWNPLTRVYDPYTRCRVDNDIPVEPFGTGWFYSVTVYESYYEDDA